MAQTFGSVIRAARQRKGLTLREVARRLGISAAYLSDMELDRRNPPSGTLRRAMLAMLGVAEDGYLRYLEGRFPEELVDREASPTLVGRALDAFRQVIVNG